MVGRLQKNSGGGKCGCGCGVGGEGRQWNYCGYGGGGEKTIEMARNVVVVVIVQRKR